MSFLVDPPLPVAAGTTIEGSALDQRTAPLLEVAVLATFLGGAVALFARAPAGSAPVGSDSGRDFLASSGVLHLDHERVWTATHTVAAGSSCCISAAAPLSRLVTVAAYRQELRVDIQEAIAKGQDAITVNRVYGEPYEREGVILIPAAEVRGGGGGGGGSDASKESSGSGGGYGINARPVGAYVVEEGRVRWEPAVDVTGIAVRVMLTVLGLAFLLRRLFD